MIAYILSAIAIISRAYLFFNELTVYMFALDMLFLVLFGVLIAYKREFLYPGVLAFLPSVSIYLAIVNKPISDLLLASFLMTFCIIVHKKSFKSLSLKEPLTLFLLLYLSLALILLLSNLYNLFVPAKMDGEYYKYVDYLFLTTYASFVFLVNYEEKDADILATALVVAIISYLAASTMGYFYFDYRNVDIIEYERGGFDFLKNLMRYPGLSSSNYIGHIILIMIMIAYSIRQRPFYLYALLVIFTSISTQSRTVFFTGVIFLSYSIYQAMTHRKVELKSVLKNAGILGIVTAALIFFVFVNEDLQMIASLFKDRLTMDLGLENVRVRLDLIVSSIDAISGSYKNLFFGIGLIPDELNPHNFIFQAILLFGIVPSIFIFSYYVYLVTKTPMAIIILIAASGEILFYTSSYDFLFFILIFVNLCRKRDSGAVKSP